MVAHDDDVLAPSEAQAEQGGSPRDEVGGGGQHQEATARRVAHEQTAHQHHVKGALTEASVQERETEKGAQHEHHHAILARLEPRRGGTARAPQQCLRSVSSRTASCNIWLKYCLMYIIDTPCW